MIERYTIKFAPAVSQKELEKVLHMDGDDSALPELHKMKARIEVVADFEDLKKLSDVLREMAKLRNGNHDR